jgi:hypothetical protein
MLRRVQSCERATETLRRYQDHGVLEQLLGDYGSQSQIFTVDRVEGRRRLAIWKDPAPGGDASTVGYSPADVGDWDPDPAFVNTALDQLADRVTTIEAWDAGDLPYTPGDGLDWPDPDPTEVEGALDKLADRVTTVEAWDADDIDYTPTTSGDWSPQPTEVEGALDQLAHRISTVQDSRGWHIQNPTASDDALPCVFAVPYSTTLKKVFFEVSGGTNVIFNLEIRTNPFNTGTTVWTSGDKTATTTSWSSPVSSFNNDTIAANGLLVLMITSVSGSVVWFTVGVQYEYQVD